MAFEPSSISWPSWRIVACEAAWIVVNKPIGLPVHGGPEHIDDVVCRVAAWLRERGESDYLSVHSRLDKDVSGLLFFGRERSRNAAIAEAMTEHRIRRVYRAIVADGKVPDQFTLRDNLLAPSQGPTRVVRNGGLEAVTRGRVLKRRAGRALVELCPETGRRHQLRVQLASRGAPIVGDILYGGAAAGRLMLHSTELVSKELGIHLRCQLPASMQLSETASPDALAELVFDAAWRRAPLGRQHEAYRLINGEGDDLEGVVVDRYGDFAVAELFSEDAIVHRERIVQAVSALGAKGVYVKCRPRLDLRRANPEVLCPTLPDEGEAAPESLTVSEGGALFAIALGDGYDTGLYLDQRENRARVRETSSGKRVLNLFGYTGSFSVSAALGGAASTTTVDLSERALCRARRNFELNQLPLVGHRLIASEVLHWLGRAQRRHELFDLVILDPPSFSTTGKGRVFRLADAWETMLERALGLLSPEGRMLVVSHERHREAAQLRRRVRQAAERAGKKVRTLVDAPSGIDCPRAFEGPAPSLSLWLQLGDADLPA